MNNGIRTGHPCRFDKGRSSKFRVGSRVRQTPDEGQGIYRPKRYENNNKDNSQKTLNGENTRILSLLVIYCKAKTVIFVYYMLPAY